MAISLLLTSSGQQWQFYIATDKVVRNSNFTLVLPSSGEEWQFHITTDIWSRMKILHCY